MANGMQNRPLKKEMARKLIASFGGHWAEM